MRHIGLDESSVPVEDPYCKLRLNSPVGGWFPALQTLSWSITESNLPYADLFFSPHLEEVFIQVSWSLSVLKVPSDILPTIASTISILPTSTLQVLLVVINCRTIPSTYLKDSLSSVVLRCGASLTEFSSPIPLSGAAVNHLIQLPHLRTWRTRDPPPVYSPSSLPLVFAPLTKFTLEEHAAHGWLYLFKRLQHGVSTTKDATPLSRVKESLQTLDIDSFPDPIIDSSFASTIQMFRNLVSLNVGAHCHDENGHGQCAFKLDNDGVNKLAMALPRLESLFLGRACHENTCATTVACLLAVSVCCVKLQELEVHFNTTNITDDFKNISEDPRFRELRSLPRCTVPYLEIYQTPLTLDEPGLETVVNGMLNIFPALRWFAGREQAWDRLNKRIMTLRER